MRYMTYMTRTSKGLLWLSVLWNFFGSVVAAEPKQYQFAVVPQFETTRMQEIWVPILRRIESISKISLKLVVPGSIPEFEQHLNTGVYDFAYVNPYQFVVANKKFGYIPLVRDVSTPLYGILVVKKSSAINSPLDLNQKKVAFPSANSLGASLLIRAQLKDKYHIDFTPMYVRSHDSVFLNVIGGFTDAGGAVQSTLAKQSKAIQMQLKVIATTEQVAPHPIVAHPKIPANDRERVQLSFIEMGNNDSDRKLLASVPMSAVGKAASSDYDSVRRLNLERFTVQGQP